MNDNVNHPSHYTDGKIEVINFIEDKNLNFHRGNAVKYIARAGKKNPEKEVEDLEKAVWYTNREIQRINGQSKNSVLLEHLEALKKFINGEWVDTDIIQTILGIDFSTGLKMFDFSRTAEWNPAPLNGQKITTKFRLKTVLLTQKVEKLEADIKEFERETDKETVTNLKHVCRVFERALNNALGVDHAYTDAYKAAEEEIKREDVEDIYNGDCE
jgi:hypothetical protein